MKRESDRRRSSPEAIRRRMENSLPWSLSRWLSNLWRQKK